MSNDELIWLLATAALIAVIAVYFISTWRNGR
jgi:hypothetical protein